MSEEFDSLSAHEYLLASAKGPKFYFEDLPSTDWDSGPFGDDRYDGVSWLDTEIPADVKALAELGIREMPELVEWPGKLLTLDFEFLESKFHTYESSFSWSHLLLIATPRDPHGPFTVSVYQDWRLVGWLTGPDSEAFATHLVETQDFGAVVLPREDFDIVDGRYILNYYLRSPTFVTVCRMPNRILSSEVNPPSKLQWDYEPEVVDLPRRVNWETGSLVRVNLENNEKAASLEMDDVTWFDDEEIILVPDVWNKDSSDVYVYVGDGYVGRIADPSEAKEFHDGLGGVDHKLGRARRGYFYKGEDEPNGVFEFDGAFRPILRIDWNQVQW